MADTVYVAVHFHAGGEGHLFEKRFETVEDAWHGTTGMLDEVRNAIEFPGHLEPLCAADDDEDDETPGLRGRIWEAIQYILFARKGK